MSTSVFIAALFTIVKMWKQPERPSTEEWIKKTWCLHTAEYYSAIKKMKYGIYSNIGGPRDYYPR